MPMNDVTEAGMGQYQAYMLAQVTERAKGGFHWPGPGPAITISYQTGAGEQEIAGRLAGILQAGEPAGAPPWTVFDRQLVEQTLKEHSFPEQMARFMPEDRRSFIQETIDELLGLHPPAWVAVPQIGETVLRLADMGHVIFVGRGACFITGRMPNVFHVRVVASLANRVERVRQDEHLALKQAAKFVARRDRGRSRYVRAYYRGRPDDALLYHLVINTDRIPCEAAARLIAEQARLCFQVGTNGSA